MRVKNYVSSVGERMPMRNFSAFTLTELMLGLTFGLLVIGGAILFARSMSRQVLESERSLQIVKNKDRIYQILTEDLNRAIYFDGQSTEESVSYGGGLIQGARGLSRWPDTVRSSSTDNDELIIVAEKFPGLSQPVQISGALVTYNSINEETLDSFIAESFQKFNLFSLTITSSRELVEKDGFSANELTVQNGAVVLSELQGQVANLSPVELIKYKVSNDQLVRQSFLRFEDLNSDSNAVSSRVLAENVSKFQVDYGFRNRTGSLLLPDHRLSHPEEFQTPYCQGPNCCDPLTEHCPGFADVFDVEVSVDLFFENANEIDLSGDAGFQQVGNRVIYSVSRVIIPGQLGILTADTDLTGQIGCNPNDIFTRCNADCDGAFTSPDRNSPRWIGYQTGSPYCQCGTNNGDFTPPEIRREGMPSWETRGANTRIKACLAAFNPCSTGWLQSLHPGAYLACNCLQPRSDTVQQNNDGSYSLMFDESDLQSVLLDSLSNPSSEHNMDCRAYRYCDQKIAQYLGAGDLPTSNPWEQRCECLINNIDVNGVTQPNQKIYKHMRRWDKLCNLEATDPNDSDHTPVCSNTIVADGDQYKLSLYDDLLNPQGLRADDAMFCQCLRQNNTGGRFNSVRVNSDYDLRVPNPPGANEIVNSAERSTRGTFGSQESLNVAEFEALSPVDNDNDGRPDGFLPTNLQGGNCNLNYCHNIGPGLGCTTSTHPNSADEIDFIESQLAPRFRPYANYCTNQANSGLRIDPGNRNEIQRVREIITGTAPNGALPNWCGGANAEGSAL